MVRLVVSTGKTGCKLLKRQGGSETRIHAGEGGRKEFPSTTYLFLDHSRWHLNPASPIHYKARCFSSPSMASLVERYLINHRKLMIKKLIRVFSSINL